MTVAERIKVSLPQLRARITGFAAANGYVFVHADYRELAWAGEGWVPHKDGIATGNTPVKVFPTIAAARATAQGQGIYLEPTLAERIEAEIGPQLERFRNAVAEGALDGISTKSAGYLKIRELADEAAKLAAPYVPCRKGCAHCCHMAVGITGYEAELIGRYTRRKPAKPPPFDGSSVAHRVREKFTLVPRTFLNTDTNECTIYPVRPLACRLHMVAEESSKACEFYEGAQTVNYINVRTLEFAGAILFAQHKGYGDIREFFPAEGGQHEKKAECVEKGT